MTIAVITFFQSQTNYGQLLQAYALQQVLMRMGHYPYIIRYGFHEPLDAVLKLEIPKPHFEKLLTGTRGGEAKEGKADNRHFDDFRWNHLNLSANAYNCLEELQLAPPMADCYLTGSDQVWAQLLSHEDNQAFFLNFGLEETLRISYAPSFALKTYPSELDEQLANSLRRLDAVSVREKAGVDICAGVGISARWVLDPTMLLQGEYYRRLASESQTKLPKDYAFVYHVNVGRKDISCWNTFCDYNEKHGIHVIAVHANGENQCDVEFLKEAEYMYPSIQDWIRLIDGSRYVLTTSFHGMIFAILLHKPFFVVLRPDSQFAGNERITTILSELSLQDYIVKEGMNLQEKMQCVINWEEVDEKLDTLRRNSTAFLEESLSERNSNSDDAPMPAQVQQFFDWLIWSLSSERKENKEKELEISQLKQRQSELLRQQSEQQKHISSLKADCIRLAVKGKRHLKVIRGLALSLIIMLLLLFMFSLFC